MKNLIALILLALAALPASAACVKFKTEKDGGLHWYMCASGDTKPTATTVPVGSIAIESDTLQWYRVSQAGAWTAVPEAVTNATRSAGERNEDSTTGTDYTSTSPECWPVTVNTADDITTVYNGPAVLQYAYVNTVLSAHTVLLVDGSTTKLTLPASMAAGSSPNIAGTMFRTSLVVDPDNSSTGNITVCFRPLDADSTWTP